MPTPSYLEFLTLPGRPTIHDDVTPDTTEVFPITFQDGSLGLLPRAQVEALANVLNYNLDQETRHWEENPCDNHIMHSLNLLEPKR